ncbi:alpha/beta fold hydrolase [Streptomyces fuscigenes]|uniref:alpha/beta fold hydrolase n=1 Tax=Streptomyces fuscigenes TaxID=1528880 RepID=UPI001F401E7D|nr:alpha/beta hydrolase [Streptomyces fuscigenes]MCF3963536.1 alpha/beta hydrolase [Streptomyces fuscigenes]
MIRYTPGMLTAHDGIQIAGYTWLPESGRPRALIQIAHGAAEHALRYDRFARLLTDHGYGVLATDLRGHGATANGGFGAAGADGDTWRADVADLRTAGEKARTLFPDVPVFLLGHGMGAMLARDYAQEHPDDLAGLILTGAARTLPGCEIAEAAVRLELEIEKEGRDARSPFLADLFASFNEGFEHRTGFEWLSRDESEVDAYAEDERCGFPFSAGLALDWVLGVRKINDPRALARVPADLPVHLAVGEQDPSHQGMTLLYELLEDYRYLGTRDLTWKAYPGARHEVLNETNRDEVHRDLTDWIGERVL